MFRCTICKSEFPLDDMAVLPRDGHTAGICVRCWHNAIDDAPAAPRRLSKIDREIAAFVNHACNPPAYKNESI